MATPSSNGFEAKATLLNQSSRIEKHRTNFETLKGEFLNLQRRYDELKDEYSELSRNYVHITEKSEEVIRELQEERDLKIMECEQLKTEVFTPTQMIDLKETITTEVEDAYRRHLEALQVELQVLRNDHKKIIKNYEYLKTEHDSVQVMYENKIKETKKRLQNEISGYKETCKELSCRLEKDVPGELQKIRQLQRESAELSECNSAMIMEIEQLRTQRDATDTAKDQHAFVLNQRISELQATLEHVSNDRTSLESQNKHLQNEIDSQIQLNQSLTQQLLDHQREEKMWKRKHKDCLHEHAREMDTLQRKSVQELQVYQEERRRQNEELELCRIENDTQELMLKQLETAISEKDKELSVAVEKAIETEWQRRVEIEKERMNLETKLTNSQRESACQSEEYGRTLGQLKDEITSLNANKCLIEAELQSAQNELKQQNVICTELTKDQIELKDLRNKISSFKHEISRLQQSNAIVEEEHESLLTKNQIMSQQIQSLHSELSQIGEHHAKDMEKFKSEHEEGRLLWKNRLDDVNSQKKTLEEKLTSVKRKRAKLQKDHQRSIHEVERLLELAHENEKQAMIEKDKIRKSADENIKLLKSQLKTVRKQHHHFFKLISNSPDVLNLSALEIDATELSSLTFDKEL